MYCKFCGEKISDNSNFCQFCGGRQNDNTTFYRPVDAELSGLERLFAGEVERKKEADAAMFDIRDGVLTRFVMPIPAVSEVTIPESVTVIDDNAFCECKGITKVTLSKNVKRIGDNAFFHCSDLKEICFAKDGALQTIGDSAFCGCSSLKDISIPDTVTSIGNSAFAECTALKTVSLAPKSKLKSVGVNAFVNCNNLTSVFISDIESWCNIEFFTYCSYSNEYKINSNPLTYAKNLYLNGELVTDLIIPEGVTEIPCGSFSNYKNLKTIKLPNSLISIGDCAFYCCYGLSQIIIPDSVTSIGNAAFYGCSNITEITIPKDVERIGKSAFIDCVRLKKLIFPPNCKLKEIHRDAFSSYLHSSFSRNIEEVHIPDISFWLNIKFHDGYSVPFNEKTCLYINERPVTDLVIPHDITRIEPFAFQGLTTLKSVTIPDTVTLIGTDAFRECKNLSRISLSRNTVLGNSVFYCCAGTPTFR